MGNSKSRRRANKGQVLVAQTVRVDNKKNELSSVIVINSADLENCLALNLVRLTDECGPDDLCVVCESNKHLVKLADIVVNRDVHSVRQLFASKTMVVVSWRWDIQKGSTLEESSKLTPSKSLVAAVNQARLNGFKYIWMDFATVPQYSTDAAELMKHVKASRVLYETCPVIVGSCTLDIFGDGAAFLPSFEYISRLWTTAEMSAMLQNPNVSLTTFFQIKRWTYKVICLVQNISSNLYRFDSLDGYNSFVSTCQQSHSWNFETLIATFWDESPEFDAFCTTYFAPKVSHFLVSLVQYQARNIFTKEDDRASVVSFGHLVASEDNQTQVLDWTQAFESLHKPLPLEVKLFCKRVTRDDFDFPKELTRVQDDLAIYAFIVYVIHRFHRRERLQNRKFNQVCYLELLRSLNRLPKGVIDNARGSVRLGCQVPSDVSVVKEMIDSRLNGKSMLPSVSVKPIEDYEEILIPMDHDMELSYDPTFMKSFETFQKLQFRNAFYVKLDDYAFLDLPNYTVWAANDRCLFSTSFATDFSSCEFVKVQYGESFLIDPIFRKKITTTDNSGSGYTLMQGEMFFVLGLQNTAKIMMEIWTVVMAEDFLLHVFDLVVVIRDYVLTHTMPLANPKEEFGILFESLSLCRYSRDWMAHLNVNVREFDDKVKAQNESMTDFEYYTKTAERLAELGLLDHSIVNYSRALQCCVSRFGEDGDWEIGRIQYNLSLVFQEKEDLKLAIRATEDCLRIYLKLFATLPDDRNSRMVMIYTRLGELYKQDGNQDLSSRNFQLALNTAKQDLELDHAVLAAAELAGSEETVKEIQDEIANLSVHETPAFNLEDYRFEGKDFGEPSTHPFSQFSSLSNQHQDYREDVYTLALMLHNVMVDVASQYEQNGLINNHVKTMYSFACEWLDRITQKLDTISAFTQGIALPSRADYTYVMHAPRFTELHKFTSFEEAFANDLLVKVPIKEMKDWMKENCEPLGVEKVVWFCSHKWDGNQPDDRNNDLFQWVSRALGDNDNRFIWFDYFSVPQSKVNAEEKFRMLFAIPSIMEMCHVIPAHANERLEKAYDDSVWCQLEAVYLAKTYGLNPVDDNNNAVKRQFTIYDWNDLYAVLPGFAQLYCTRPDLFSWHEPDGDMLGRGIKFNANGQENMGQKRVFVLRELLQAFIDHHKNKEQ